MNYYCNKCGAALDPGERCRCGGRAVHKRIPGKVNPEQNVRRTYYIKQLDGTMSEGYPTPFEAMKRLRNADDRIVCVGSAAK